MYKNAKVILLSWHLFPDIEKVVKREDVMICPNGIKPTVNPDFQRTPNKIPHILFLSNLLIDKGVLVLLDALKLLKDKGYSFVCDFVGSETKDIDAALDQTGADIEDNIQFVLARKQKCHVIITNNYKDYRLLMGAQVIKPSKVRTIAR